MLPRLGKSLIKYEWLVVLIAVVIVVRIPTLFEPYWYGDEGIYLSIGQALNKGVGLYSQIHDNKPPLLYLVAAIAQGNLFWSKFILMAWMSITTFVFFRLAFRVFNKNIHKVILSTVLFSLLTTLPITEGNIFNSELFFLLPLITSVYLLWEKEIKKPGTILLAGALIGLAALFKVPAIFEAGIWPLVWLSTRDRNWIKNSFYLAIGVSIPLLGSGIYFWLNNSLSEYLIAAWVQNIPYLTTWKTGGVETGIFSIKGRLIVVSILIALIVGLHKKIGRTSLVLGLWFVVTLFAALLSGRPYPHYLVQSVTSLVLLISNLVFGNKRERLVGIGAILLLSVTLKLFQFYSYDPIKYYKNFIEWMVGAKTIRDYRGNFDPNVNSIYDIAEIIKLETQPSEKIFVWGDLPMLYALTNRLPVGKYTAKYHVLAFGAEKQTIELLNQEVPRVIVVAGGVGDLPGLATLLGENYFLEKEIQDIQVYRKFKKM